MHSQTCTFLVPRRGCTSITACFYLAQMNCITSEGANLISESVSSYKWIPHVMAFVVCLHYRSLWTWNWNETRLGLQRAAATHSIHSPQSGYRAAELPVTAYTRDTEGIKRGKWSAKPYSTQMTKTIICVSTAVPLNKRASERPL